MSNHNTKDEEIDLLELFSILWRGKWLITLVAILFGTVAFIVLRITPPTWQADLLLKVETKGGGIGTALVGDLGNLLDKSNNDSDAQIELIKSRSILGKTVAHFDLEKQLARPFSWTDILQPKSAIQPSRFVFHLDLPDNFHKKENKLSLYIKNDTEIELQNNEQVIVSGKQGEVLQADGYSLFFDGNDAALIGEKFPIVILDNIEAINHLRRRLSIASLDKKGSLLQMRLIGKDPNYIEQLLNNIAHNYVQRVNQQDMEKLTQGVEFIEKQLPDMQTKLQAAEKALREYQVTHKTVGLSVESETMIRALAQVETELTELRLKENELQSRYTTNHPLLQSLVQQRKTLNIRKDEIERKLNAVPQSTQGVLKLRRDVEVNQTIYLQMVRKLQEFKLIKASTVSGVQIIDSALTGSAPIKPKKLLIISIAMLAGIILTAVSLLILQLLQHRILSAEDVIESTGLNVIATIPESKRQLNREKLLHRKVTSNLNNILSLSNPEDLSVEALRSLCTSLHFVLQKEENKKVFLISGPTEDVGKSFISANLAVLLAQMNKKVILINADLRKSYLDQQFGFEKRQDQLNSLVQYLQQNNTAPESCIHHTGVEGLDFIPGGASILNSSQLLSGKKIKELIIFLKEHYEVVLIDSSPILLVSDPLILASHADYALLVTQFNKTLMHELVNSYQKFSLVSLNTLGVIINGIRKNILMKNKYYE